MPELMQNLIELSLIFDRMLEPAPAEPVMVAVHRNLWDDYEVNQDGFTEI